MSNPLDPEKLFGKGGPLERLYPLHEANDTFLRTPGHVTHAPSHARDAIDLKRLMVTVVVALGGCMVMAMYNTGYQANLAIQAGAPPLDNWQTMVFQFLGLQFLANSVLSCVVHGAQDFILAIS